MQLPFFHQNCEIDPFLLHLELGATLIIQRLTVHGLNLGHRSGHYFNLYQFQYTIGRYFTY